MTNFEIQLHRGVMLLCPFTGASPSDRFSGLMSVNEQLIMCVQLFVLSVSVSQVLRSHISSDAHAPNKPNYHSVHTWINNFTDKMRHYFTGSNKPSHSLQTKFTHVLLNLLTDILSPVL